MFLELICIDVFAGKNKYTVNKNNTLYKENAQLIFFHIMPYNVVWKYIQFIIT